MNVEQQGKRVARWVEDGQLDGWMDGWMAGWVDDEWMEDE